VGARFYLPTANKVSPYVYANVFKVFTTIDISLNATGDTYNTDGSIYQEMSATSSNGELTISNTVHNADGTTTVYTNTQDVKSELDAITSLLSPYGGNLGIGATYAIDDGLNLFGEFGIQGILDSMSYSNEFPYKQNDKVVLKTTIESTLSALFGLTRVAIGIRFNWL
jgi:hypothetical protein